MEKGSVFGTMGMGQSLRHMDLCHVLKQSNVGEGFETVGHGSNI